MLIGAGGGWLSARRRDDDDLGQHGGDHGGGHDGGRGLTDGRAVLGELSDAAVGGQPCQQSISHGWHTDGGFGGGGGGCVGGGAGGGYTGLFSILTVRGRSFKIFLEANDFIN